MNRATRGLVSKRFAPARADAVHPVEIDGEAVLLDQSTNRLHLLNATAALVWSCFDGVATIEEIARDISDELGAPYAQVLAETRSIVRDFGNEGLLANVAARRNEPDDAPPLGDVVADPRFVVEPQSPWLEENLRLVEAVSMTVRAGRRVIGVRTDSHEIASRLRSLLGPAIESAIKAPVNLTLREGVIEGRTRDSHLLYRGGALVFHSRVIDELLLATIAQLDAYVPDPPGITRVNTRTLVRDGAAVLVSDSLRATLDRVQRRLERQGFRVAITAGAALDRASLEVVGWVPRVDVDAHAWDALTQGVGADREVLLTSSCRVPLRALIAPGPDADGAGAAARQVSALAALVVDANGRTSAGDLELMARVARERAVTMQPEFTDGELLEALRSL